MHSNDVVYVPGVSSNVQPEEDEGIVLQPNIMEGPGERLCRPHNMEVDLWTEVLRLNKYLGQRTHLNVLQEIWILSIIFFLFFIKYEGLNHFFGHVERGPLAQQIPRPEDSFQFMTGDLEFEHYFFSLFFVKFEGLNHCFGPVTEVLRLNT